MKQTNNPPGATPLSEEELDGLKIKSITTRGELDRWEQENIANAMEWLDQRTLPDSYIFWLSGANIT